MRLTLAIAAALIAGPVVLPQVAQAQDRPPAYTNAETCLRDRAPDAVAASNGAADAADFLLNYLCAEQVSYATAYENNSALIGAFESMSEFDSREYAEPVAVAEADNPADPSLPPPAVPAESDESFSMNPFEGLSVDPITGEIGSSDPDLPINSLLPMLSPFMGLQGGNGAGQPPLFLRVLAGELVLQQRR
ncbi:MAG: hypothetical protein KKF88_12805 [Alphaproteobacteria bacterium]|nr:hypothetical protein [Alphaproteobacteria bacterium]